jgi:hypothetical protein
MDHAQTSLKPRGSLLFCSHSLLEDWKNIFNGILFTYLEASTNWKEYAIRFERFRIARIEKGLHYGDEVYGEP